MINTNYLQMLKVDEDIQHVYLESVQEIEDIVAPIRVLEMRRQQEMELGIFTEAADTLYTEGVKEAVTKIGDKIIEIINRIMEFVKGIPDMFKNRGWDKADVVKRANMLKKDDPKKYDELKIYINKGMIDFNTYESMKDFYASYDDLLSELKKKDADEKTLKGKLDKMKKSLEDKEKAVKTVSTMLGLVVAGTTIALNIPRILTTVDQFLQGQSARMADKLQKQSHDGRMLANTIKNEISGSDGYVKGSYLAQGLALCEEKQKGSISKMANLRVFLWKKVDSIVRAYDSSSLNKTNINHGTNKAAVISEVRANANKAGKAANYNYRNFMNQVRG